MRSIHFFFFERESSEFNNIVRNIIRMKAKFFPRIKNAIYATLEIRDLIPKLSELLTQNWITDSTTLN